MITLRQVDDSNLQEILELDVSEDQQGFVFCSRTSMKELRGIVDAGEWAAAFGIYDDDLPVGFVMFVLEKKVSQHAPAVAAGNYDIAHFYIDQRYQRKGYGKAGIKLSIDYLKTLPCGKADYIWIAWNPSNHAAERLYTSAGFTPTDMRNYGEIVGIMPLEAK